MAGSWYYGKPDDRRGPVSDLELKELVVSGQIRESDLVWQEGMTDWIPASDASQFFSGQDTPSTPPSPVQGMPQVTSPEDQANAAPSAVRSDVDEEAPAPPDLSGLLLAIRVQIWVATVTVLVGCVIWQTVLLTVFVLIGVGIWMFVHVRHIPVERKTRSVYDESSWEYSSQERLVLLAKAASFAPVGLLVIGFGLLALSAGDQGVAAFFVRGLLLLFAAGMFPLLLHVRKKLTEPLSLN